jgi:fucose 4-O-acetylase-like acetyltransferase
LILVARYTGAAVSVTRSLTGRWSLVRERARATPSTRNRYADLLRAASIVVVVIGHWLMAAPAGSGVQFTLSDMLHVAPWTQWLTWVFQVMPLFFVVGGYANAASWEAARASGVGYGVWVSRRLQRLVRPVVPFLLVWCALGLSARWLGLSRDVVRNGSEAAFVPTWFLAVYLIVVVLAPPMHHLWRRFGMTSFWAFVVGAAVIDTLARATAIEAIPWINYIFVWLAIHQLGYAWRDGMFSKPYRAVSFALGGLAALVVLVGLASYPVSMVTVPGERAANSNPPTLALLALAVTHAGIALALEARAQKLLDRLSVWTVVVFVNGVVMTLYLWHATVMVLLLGVAEPPGSVGLHFVPDTPAWWLTRIPWVLLLATGLAGFVAIFGRVEARRSRSDAAPRAWRSIAGAIALCVGLATLSAGGVGDEGELGIRPAPVMLAFAGTLLATVRGGPRRRPVQAVDARGS